MEMKHTIEEIYKIVQKEVPKSPPNRIIIPGQKVTLPNYERRFCEVTGRPLPPPLTNRL